MANYTLLVDSACDISAEDLASWGVECAPMTFMFADDTKPLTDRDMSVSDFYAQMRAGRQSKTAALNTEDIRSAMEPVLKAGRDVIYLAFSSGLSSTFNSSLTVARELQEEYPDRVAISVDSLSASAGYGLLVYLAVQKMNEGASIWELEAYIQENRQKMVHWFTVDDLVYLKRGGRISPAVALIGTALGIKPVLHVDEDGHLQSVGKARGRKASIKALVEQYANSAIHPNDGPVFISNADCEADAKALEEMLIAQFGVHATKTYSIGPVIGSHSGPGTLALFFEGNVR